MIDEWEHLNDLELVVYHEFYEEYLVALIYLLKRNKTQEAKDKVDLIELRVKSLQKSINKRS